MKIFNKKRFIALLITLVLIITIAFPVMLLAAAPPVNLLSTSSFAVLAGSTITNTGPTVISGDAGGDIGLHPGTSFPGQTDVTITNGAVHLTDAVALQAKNDLILAYDDAAGRTPETTIESELGGKTLTPGVYVSIDGTFQITGTLTLDAQGDPEGVFVFKTSSTLITATDSKVDLINKAKYCRIFWQVGSSATLGTNSYFVGHLFALTSITANTGAEVQGQLLARNGAVTLDTNIITNGFCAAETTAETTAAETTAETTAAQTTAAQTTAAETTAEITAEITAELQTTISITAETSTIMSPQTTDTNIKNVIIGVASLASISIFLIYKSKKYI